MIGISGECRVKVWCHEDLAEVAPERRGKNNRVERDMVNRVVDIVEGVTDATSRVRSFGKATKYKTLGTFQEALRVLGEFADGIGMHIPTCLERTQKVLKGRNSKKTTPSKKSPQVSRETVWSNIESINSKEGKIEQQPRLTAPFSQKGIYNTPDEQRKPTESQYFCTSPKQYKSISPQLCSPTSPKPLPKQ